ncbi:hypothetical protein MKEN_01368400 [Mycena kentingensis (nom. inval.)]|nr:hypothetical protein MKEN_01368400 [Mycena kentingensis (nom. inval.)]
MDGSNAAKMTIPIFVGTILNWTLLGILALQICVYFYTFRKDHIACKLLVVLVSVAEILQTTSATRDATRIFGTQWGNPASLDEVGFAWFTTPVTGGIVACAGQLFFAWRIYAISRSIGMPLVITVITLFQSAMGLWAGVSIAQAQHFSALQFQYFKIPTAWLSAAAAADLLIVASTCFYLLRSRVGINRSLDAIVVGIIKITVETGLICAIFALADLFVFVAYPRSNLHLAICIALSKIYSNSILLILNSRATISYVPIRELELEASTMADMRFGTDSTSTAQDGEKGARPTSISTV